MFLLLLLCYYCDSANPALTGRGPGVTLSPALCSLRATARRLSPLWEQGGKAGEGLRDGWLSADLQCVQCLMEVSIVSQPSPHNGAWAGSSPALLMFPDIGGVWQALRGFAEREGIPNEAEASSPRL